MLQLNSPYYAEGFSVYYKFDRWRIKHNSLNRSACSSRELFGSPKSDSGLKIIPWNLTSRFFPPSLFFLIFPIFNYLNKSSLPHSPLPSMFSGWLIGIVFWPFCLSLLHILSLLPFFPSFFVFRLVPSKGSCCSSGYWNTSGLYSSHLIQQQPCGLSVSNHFLPLSVICSFYHRYPSPGHPPMCNAVSITIPLKGILPHSSGFTFFFFLIDGLKRFPVTYSDPYLCLFLERFSLI